MSINAASRLTGVSIPTIRAKLDKGLLPNAKKIPNGKRSSWEIPLNDLINAKLFKPEPIKEETDQELIKGLELTITAYEQLLENTRTLHARDLEELDAYKRREALLFKALETKAVQEKRRKFWSFSN